MRRVNYSLKMYRLKAGLTQIELAEKLPIKERVVTFWETGRSEPSIEQAVDAARILGAEPQEVFPELYRRIKR